MSVPHYKIFGVGVVTGAVVTKILYLQDIYFKSFACGVVIGVVVGRAALGILDLFVLGLRVDHWPAHVCRRISTTLKYLVGSVGFTAVGIILGSKIEQFILRNCELVWVVAGSCSAIAGSWLVCRYIPYKSRFLSKKHAAWAFRCITLGSVVGLITPRNRVKHMAIAGLATVTIVGGYVTHVGHLPNAFINWGGRLKIGLGIVVISTLAANFTLFDNPLRVAFGCISAFGGLALFSAYLLHDHHKLKAKVEATSVDAPFDPINEHTNLFSAFSGLFLLFTFS